MAKDKDKKEAKKNLKEKRLDKKDKRKKTSFL